MRIQQIINDKALLGYPSKISYIKKGAKDKNKIEKYTWVLSLLINKS